MPKMPRYTQEEDNWLRENYHNSSRAMLLKRFPNRTLGGISIHAQSRLRLKKDVDAFDWGLPEVSTMIGHLSETEKAYLAGIIDGEGHIALHHHSKKGKPGNYYYVIHVAVVNTSTTLKKWFERHMSKNATFFISHRENRPQWRDCWHWTMNGAQQCMVFLREISPYLIIKKKQAELLSRGCRALTDKQRETLYMRLKKLRHTS